MTNTRIKIFKLGFAIFFIAAEFFNFSLAAVAIAATCTVAPFWADTNNNALAGGVNTAKTGTSDNAVATFTNCQGLSPSFTLYGGPYGNFTGTSVGLGGAITQASEQRNATVSFSQDGQYFFKVLASNPNIGQSGTAQSSIITASANAPAQTQQPGPSGTQQPSGTIGTQQPQPTGTQQAQPAGTQQPGPSGTQQPATTIDCSKNPDPNKCLINPIPNQDDITSLLITIMKGFLGIVAVWAVAFIVIGGFRMIVSSGNEEAVAAAKKTIQWAVLGLVVAIMSFVIIAIVQNFIGVDVKPVTTTFINKNYYDI